MAQTLPVRPIPGGLPQPQGYPTGGRKMYKIHFSIKQRPLVVASRNVRTPKYTGQVARRRTALIACEFARYNIDIAALSETRLPHFQTFYVVPLYKWGLVTHFSRVAYPQLPIAFMALDLQSGLRFCRAPMNPPLQ